jgi:hypothetical protein
MLNFLKFIYLILLLYIQVKIGYSKLLSVINVNRHGARTPKTFAKISKKIYYVSYGSHLIVNGVRQAQLLGRWMYSRYAVDLKFLNDQFDSKDCVFYSSPSSRAILSATAFIQGFYKNYIIKPIHSNDKSNINSELNPPVDMSKVNSDLIRELPLYIFDQTNDIIFHAYKCKSNKDSKEKIKEELFNKAKIFSDITEEEILLILEEIRSNAPFFFNGLSKEETTNKKFLKDILIFLKQLEEILIVKYNFSPLTRQLIRQFHLNKTFSKFIGESVGKKIAVSGFFEYFASAFDNVVHKTHNKLKYTLAFY